MWQESLGVACGLVLTVLLILQLTGHMMIYLHFIIVVFAVFIITTALPVFLFNTFFIRIGLINHEKGSKECAHIQLRSVNPNSNINIIIIGNKNIGSDGVGAAMNPACWGNGKMYHSIFGGNTATAAPRWPAFLNVYVY